jgi:hypothetical protein
MHMLAKAATTTHILEGAFEDEKYSSDIDLWSVSLSNAG